MPSNRGVGAETINRDKSIIQMIEFGNRLIVNWHIQSQQRPFAEKSIYILHLREKQVFRLKICFTKNSTYGTVLALPCSNLLKE